MKRIALLFFICCLTTASVAQSTLTGSVRDGAGKPLSFSSIALLNANDSTLAKGGISSETGIYELTGVRAGRYVVSASSVGYKTNRSAAFEVTATTPHWQAEPVWRSVGAAGDPCWSTSPTFSGRTAFGLLRTTRP